MSYLAQAGVAEVLEKVAPAVQAASKVIEDPALPEVTCQILRLNKISAGKDAGTCPTRAYTDADKHKGIGLYTAVMPLRAYVWVRQNPIPAAAIATGVVLLIGAVGYHMGRRAR